ncbi:hypothetical protein BDW02DRAFT_596882 [Decorospora gaudefroyi]|uniref:Essential protein Yae1 N-terminal domain-containing protein n=1 Tax=Decorospora gaudefroyi TaxID=184978 RepID=A0A6A5KNI6_9PLEO|nr:hypothetical protein BDW02DRAFT_596882 [Decorospora gaudefroyi]
MTTVPLANRLQALLDCAREANQVKPNHTPLVDFLASLQQEAQGLKAAQLKQIKLAICDTLSRLVNSGTSSEAEVSQATQTFVATVSRAIQTDAATISLWDLLPRARNEAYERGYNAGKGIQSTEGIEKGKAIAYAEGLATGIEQGLETGWERGFEDGMQRGMEMGRHAGYAVGLAEGTKRAKNEQKGTCSDLKGRISPEPKAEAVREKIVVKLPPTVKVAEKREAEREEEQKKVAKKGEAGKGEVQVEKRKKENVKPMSSGADPFASLLGLVRTR